MLIVNVSEVKLPGEAKQNKCEIQHPVKNVLSFKSTAKLSGVKMEANK
jgi:hypothetical protein